MKTRVLLVDDEADLIATVRFNLEKEGYEVATAENGSRALTLAHSDPIPALVLLDLMLPDLSGTEVCRRLRADPKTADIPVIILTAKGEELDRVTGLQLGADDYVVKPFSVRELLLRVRAVLRRLQPGPGPARNLSFGTLRVDGEAHRVWVENEEVPLTVLELKLLTTLLERKGRVQSRERLLAEVWNMRSDLTTRTVDTHVKRLRQKLGAAGNYIETVRGVGYRFRENPGPPE